MRMIVSVLSLLVATSAFAQSAGWESSLQPDVVSTYLSSDGAVMVAAAGAPSADLSEAATALTKALREGHRAKSVFTGEGLGSLAELDDAAIVKKCAMLPVDAVAVVRVFPGAEGEAPTAVVALYSKQGEPMTALSVQKGSALAAASGQVPGQGATAAAVETISKIQKQTSTAGEGAKDEYEKNYLWFEELVAVNARTGETVSRWTNPFKGKYRVPLKGAAFYEEIGRPELAESYRSKDTRRLMVAGGGLLLSLVGTGVAISANSSDSESGALTKGAVGLGALFGGVAMMIVGMRLDPNPVSAVEMRQLADEHNIKLRQKLGLPKATAARTEGEGEKGKSPVWARLAFGRNSGGLVLGGTF